LRVALLILKYIFREDIRERLPGILKFLRDLSEKRTGMEYIETILRYIVNAAPTDNIGREDLRAAVDEALPHRGGEIMPTIADEWIKEGMQQGFLQALREVLIEVLEDRFETVSQTLRKSLRDINDPDVLRSLHKKALRATSLEEFMDAVKVALA